MLVPRSSRNCSNIQVWLDSTEALETGIDEAAALATVIKAAIQGMHAPFAAPAAAASPTEEVGIFENANNTRVEFLEACQHILL